LGPETTLAADSDLFLIIVFELFVDVFLLSSLEEARSFGDELLLLLSGDCSSLGPDWLLSVDLGLCGILKLEPLNEIVLSPSALLNARLEFGVEFMLLLDVLLLLLF